ncbi:MAG: aldehyde dehydrogenase family protein [Caulobacterales bacterium]|nr:aldehyde dehydrogenase family protein [Caulobacterales bacterium]
MGLFLGVGVDRRETQEARPAMPCRFGRRKNAQPDRSRIASAVGDRPSAGDEAEADANGEPAPPIEDGASASADGAETSASEDDRAAPAGAASASEEDAPEPAADKPRVKVPAVTAREGVVVPAEGAPGARAGAVNGSSRPFAASPGSAVPLPPGYDDFAAPAANPALEHVPDAPVELDAETGEDGVAPKGDAASFAPSAPVADDGEPEEREAIMADPGSEADVVEADESAASAEVDSPPEPAADAPAATGEPAPLAGAAAPRAARVLKLWIDGSWREASNGETFNDLNPLDDSVYAVAAKGTAVDMRAAVAAAKASFPYFKDTLPHERELWLLKAAEVMERRRRDMLDCLIDEIGSPAGKAAFEFEKALSMLRAGAGLARRMRGETLPSDAPGKMSMTIRSPRGVVACITPFNVPLIKGARLTANALACGNTVVLLPSEHAPRIAVLLAEIYQEAGLPDGALNVVTGFGHEIGDSLTGHEDVDFVTFTGSSVVGQHIHELCARNKTPVTLELGGKSPMVILNDADLDRVVPVAARSIFLYQGQVCIGASRIYVQHPLYEPFVERFAEAVSRLGLGDLRERDTVIGPIISPRQRDRVRSHIEDAVSKGAHVATGGSWEGHRCRPTVLTGVSEAMTVCKEETFGPVTSVYAIDSYEEGLVLANDTEYGLSSAIFTNDITKALHFARNIGAGMCHINGSTIHDEPHVPFGGNGESGVGREGADADLEAMTELTWVTVQM